MHPGYYFKELSSKFIWDTDEQHLKGFKTVLANIRGILEDFTFKKEARPITCMDHFTYSVNNLINKVNETKDKLDFLCNHYKFFMFTLRARKVLINRAYMKYLHLQGTQENDRQFTVYI